MHARKTRSQVNLEHFVREEEVEPPFAVERDLATPEHVARSHVLGLHAESVARTSLRSSLRSRCFRHHGRRPGRFLRRGQRTLGTTKSHRRGRQEQIRGARVAGARDLELRGHELPDLLQAGGIREVHFINKLLLIFVTGGTSSPGSRCTIQFASELFFQFNNRINLNYLFISFFLH